MPRVEVPVRMCAQCGGPIARQPHESAPRYAKRIYCSIACRSAFRSQVALDRVTAEDDLTRLRAKLVQSQQAHRTVAQELTRTRQELSRLRRELLPQSLTASFRVFPDERSATDESEPEPTNTIYALEYLELIRAHKLIRDLYRAPDGEYAAVANRMLAKISELCEAVQPRGKGGKRDAA